MSKKLIIEMIMVTIFAITVFVGGILLIQSCDNDTTKIDPVEIIRTGQDTIWTNTNTQDTVYFSDTIRTFQHIEIYKDYYVLRDSLIEFSSIKCNDYYLISKVYQSTKYDGIPYHVIVHVIDSNAKKLKTWGVYSSECKLTSSKYQYLNEARNWVKDK